MKKENAQINADFLAFKATAFKQTDSLPAGTPADMKEETHDKELAIYRQKTSGQESFDSKECGSNVNIILNT